MRNFNIHLIRFARIAFIIIITFSIHAGMYAQSTTKSGQTAKVFTSGSTTLQYLLYLPKNFQEEKSNFPLMIFLHGSGERGSDIELVKMHGPPKLAEEKDFPFIIVSPQCPAGQRWDIELLNDLVDDITLKYNVNKSRIYLTGLSMGGYGTWAFASKYPEKFAAIAPICGGGDPGNVSNIKNVPVWVFHGAKDSVVPLARSEEMVEALRKAGGFVTFTVYPEAGHDSWTDTYNNEALYEWFLNFMKK